MMTAATAASPKWVHHQAGHGLLGSPPSVNKPKFHSLEPVINREADNQGGRLRGVRNACCDRQPLHDRDFTAAELVAH